MATLGLSGASFFYWGFVRRRGGMDEDGVVFSRAGAASVMPGMAGAVVELLNLSIRSKRDPLSVFAFLTVMCSLLLGLVFFAHVIACRRELMKGQLDRLAVLLVLVASTAGVLAQLADAMTV